MFFFKIIFADFFFNIELVENLVLSFKKIYCELLQYFFI